MTLARCCRRPPRKLGDAAGQTRWQWPYSGFGEVNPQATPASGQAPLNYALRYPGQIDDGNGLFYNWHRFYDPRVGRYTSSDPIGLDGGWNRFGYVDANPLGFVDPEGLQIIRPFPGVPGFPIPNRSPGGLRDPDFPPGTGPNRSPDPIKRSPPRWWPSMPDEDAEFCRQERRRCAELCEEAECKPDFRNIWGGSIERCIRGCLPEVCGGNKKGNK
ncbi:MAG: RHS repeat-associated core domain-containing protein [Hydrogenophaga sp.]|nr:RHS repeat-associated core domain-containing protein [Hydrogenophaga sp.]